MRRRYAQQRAGLTRLPPNTYEATGVKRVNSFSPVLGGSTGSRCRSSFIHHPQHARGSTFAVHHLRACDGSDTYARSAAPHDLAIRAGRVNQAH